MPIIETIEIHTTLDTILEQDFLPKHRQTMKKELIKAIDLSEQLFQPKLAYRWVRNFELHPDKIVVYNEQSNTIDNFCIKSMDTVLSGAKELLISLATLGSLVDKTILKMNHSGDYLMAYLLDIISMSALDQLHGIVCSLAEDKARSHCWGVSPFLSPGAFEGMPLRHQSQLLEMVSSDRIDVSLNPGGMMKPLKSVSGIIALGPGFNSCKVASLCSACNQRSSCNMNKTKKTENYTNKKMRCLS